MNLSLDELSSQLAKLADDGQGDAVRSAKVDELLRPYVLAEVQIDERGLAFGTPGAAAPLLVQHGWRSFLVRMVNPHRLLGELNAPSNHVVGMIDYHSHASRIALADTLTVVPRIESSWLQVKLAGPTDVSGLDVEYKVISLYSRDGGSRKGELMFVLAVEETTESLTRPPSSKAWRRMGFESRQYAAKFEFELPACSRHPVRHPGAGRQQYHGGVDSAGFPEAGVPVERDAAGAGHVLPRTRLSGDR